MKAAFSFLFMSDFEHYYHQHFDYVYRYICLRLAEDRISAQDITSQTFYTAFKYRHRYDPKKGSWRQWITGIAKNRLLDHWQKENLTLSLQEVGEAEQLIESHGISQQKLDHKLLFDSILQSLPGQLRRLLILRYVDDLTYDQIAEITGKKPAAVRQIFSRLHKRLRAQFELNDLTS